MSPGDLGWFAVTALWRHRLRSSLSLLGVAIGVAAVILLTALGEGARVYVTSEFAALGSNLLVVFPGKNETTGSFPGMGGVPNDLTLDDALALQRGVRQAYVVAPLSTGNETVSRRGRSRQVAVFGSTPEFLTIRSLRMAEGEFLPVTDLHRGRSVAVLGMKVAQELFPGTSPIGKVVRIGDWRMRVIGVMERTGTQMGLNLDEVVLVPVATGMRMFNRTSLFRVMLKVRAYEDMDRACESALAIIRERHDEEDVTCLTQESVVSSLSSILTVLTLALGGIAAISLSVAGIGIMNLMLVSVSERTKEIGLAKAIGAGRLQILAIFLSEAILLATVGGSVGLLIGWSGIRILGLLYPAFPATAPIWAVVSALITAVLVGALFGVLPARRATRLDPVAALAGR